MNQYRTSPRVRLVALAAVVGLSSLCLGGCLAGLGPAGQAGREALRHPESVQAQLAAGQAYLEAKEYNDAFICYSRAVAADPGNFDAQLGLGRAAAYLGDVADGLEAVRQAKQTKPGDAQPVIVSGMLKLASSRAAGEAEDKLQALTEAEKLLKSGVQMAGNDLEGWKALGETRALKAQMQLEGLRALQAKGDSQGLEARQQAVEATFAGAIAAYERARTLSPQDAGIADTLGRLYGIRGEDEVAERYFREAVHLRPQQSAYQLALAWILIDQRKDLPTAQQAAQTAMELDDTSGEAALAATVALLLQGQAKQAVRDILELLRAYGEKPDLLYWYVQALLALEPQEIAQDAQLRSWDPLRRAVEAYELLRRQVVQGAPCRATPQQVKELRDRLEARMRAALEQRRRAQP